MALWMVRAGKRGGHEQKFLNEGRIYLTWNGLSHDLGQCQSRAELRRLLTNVYPNFSKGKITNHTGQIWAFSHRIKPSDWIALPSKHKPAIHFGEVKAGKAGEYHFNSKADDPYYHHREVNWFATDVPRSNFSQDILYSLGAFMAVCEIKRNKAESRIKAMAENDWKSETLKQISTTTTDPTDEKESATDLEVIAQDQIAKLIKSKYSGHGMAELVEAILQAQGYTTYRSPEGPDKGIDILAAPGPLGFGQPRLCVQVKSGATPLDRPTLDQLIGAMQNVQAEQGLLVSWGGFKSTVDREKANQFFRVRLWDSDDLIEQLQAHYQQLDDDLRAELPLKRIWTVAFADDET